MPPVPAAASQAVRPINTPTSSQVSRSAARAERASFGPRVSVPTSTLQAHAVRWIDGASGKYIDPGHEPGMTWAAAGQDLEVVALAAQQDQRGGVARAHHRYALACRGRGSIAHGDRMRSISAIQSSSAARNSARL